MRVAEVHVHAVQHAESSCVRPSRCPDPRSMSAPGESAAAERGRYPSATCAAVIVVEFDEHAHPNRCVPQCVATAVAVALADQAVAFPCPVFARCSTSAGRSEMLIMSLIREPLTLLAVLPFAAHTPRTNTRDGAPPPARLSLALRPLRRSPRETPTTVARPDAHCVTVLRSVPATTIPCGRGDA